MQFKTLALSLFVAVAAADSVSELISQIPSCAKPCLDDASTKVGCSTTDNKCQCSKMDDLTKQAITCVSTSCAASDLTKVSELSAKICTAVAAGAGSDTASSLVASASGALTSAAGSLTGASASATATSTPTASPGAGSRAGVGMGLAAAMAALAL
ncbi:hypothetical protein F5B20DRAFT_521326 [Whalleya microplaca]|nr:hypothetical protein F5B20DRAFT_521326 [Whalleya microplaca]